MANKRIVDLTAAASVATTDLFELDTGAASFKATGSQIASMVKTVAPSIVQNAGVAFGVQQNNATGRTLLAVIHLDIAFDHLSPGAYVIDVVTNATTPNPMASFVFSSAGATQDFDIQQTFTIPVAPGGFYTINNTSDPGGGNQILSVWECAL